MTTNKPEVFEVYRTRQGTLENVVLLADYEALQAEYEKLCRDAELKHAALEREVEALNTKISSVRSTLNHWNKFRPDLFAEPEFTDLMMVIFDEQEALAGGEAG